MEPETKPSTLPEDKITAFFNGLAAAPKRNYTVGEAFQHYVLNKPYEEINDNMLQFSKAGRIIERLHTGAGVLSAALIVTFAPASLLTLSIAAAVLGLYKVQGVAAGKLGDLAARGSLRAPKAPQAPTTTP